MVEKEFNYVLNNLDNFKFTSLRYTDFKELENYELLLNDDKAIIIYGYNNENKLYEYHWAANKVDDLIKNLNKRNKEKITFVPKEWVQELNKLGFDILAIWNEYVANNIESHLNYDSLKFIDEGYCKEAAKVTTSCIGQSRGFHGETEEWMKEWIQGKHPSVPDYVFKSAVIYEETDNQIVGIICVGIYGDENKILWIREIAVKPEFQGRGIGRRLVEKAFAYGLKHGAKKSFLMADEINYNTLHLYEAMGFKSNPNECQIDMNR